MPRSNVLSRPALALAVVLALLTVLAVVAGSAFGRAADPSPAPIDAPSAPPTVRPSAQLSAQPSVEPSDAPSDGSFEVDLKNLTDHDVSVAINDKTGKVTSASSAQPGDGMSVRWSDSKVENLDDATLRVVWVGLPGDETLQLSITEVGATYRLHFVQAAPPAYSDAVGFDRILELEFASPVSASDVEVSFEEATGSNG
jgi:hypothetical protein